ncbi:hypothetical protein FC15_GL000551 [Lapidilactobacillus concavus DSM 17758]|uniref:Uncharacterized protein n=1 Tax=Lapidilactobacillus concavus DSM 17758 TaxID=1423735 RepID=A0A0R1VY82_9LACO|nr:hypothetical protein FC15_GL000551 [Lapidilactobacillus concavus DSM 17758]
MNLKISRVSISPFNAITILYSDHDFSFEEIGCQQILPSYFTLPPKSEVAEDNGHDCSDSVISSKRVSSL